MRPKMFYVTSIVTATILAATVALAVPRASSAVSTSYGKCLKQLAVRLEQGITPDIVDQLQRQNGAMKRRFQSRFSAALDDRFRTLFNARAGSCKPQPTPSPVPSISPSPSASPSPTESVSASASSSVSASAAASPSISSNPPAAGGYFALQPTGSWSTLPGNAACAAQVHLSTWEPRPENTAQNQTLVDAQAVHDSFASRPRSTYGTYDTRWDSFLLPRVDGQFTGTTDEIFQWAACKWGLPDNLLRGIAVRESTWYQYLHYSDGYCVEYYGCGDRFPSQTSASQLYCDGVARTGGIDYASQWGAGKCPQTFSVVGVMSWDDPSWGFNSPDNQNGTFPFNRDSTAFAVDYMAARLFGCYEGWETWLHPTPGDIWGCVGAWYTGDWHSTAADGYISRVQNEIANSTWLTADFAQPQYACDPQKGCPI